eukprot:313592-Chlamydomonas_euryale.AAC.1
MPVWARLLHPAPCTAYGRAGHISTLPTLQPHLCASQAQATDRLSATTRAKRRQQTAHAAILPGCFERLLKLWKRDLRSGRGWSGCG